MRQIVISRAGGLDVLKIQEGPEPKAGKGEVTIKVKASGLNFADILARQGLYLDAPKTPCVVGYEVSGIIDTVGEGVDPNLLNSSVLALTKFGGQAEKVKVPVHQVFKKPESLSFEEAAAIPVIYLTAYGLLIAMGSLQKGESVLIHNAGGGVGLAAIDIAKKYGAIIYGTASASKHSFLKERGLDYPIDYRTKDWQPILNELTHDRGVELIIDPIGGTHWKKSYNALRSTGRLGMFGVSSASATGLKGKLQMLMVAIQTPWFHPFSLLDKNKAVFGLNLGHLWHEEKKITNWMNVILDGVKDGWVRPYVDKAFPFDQIGQAHDYLESRKNIGKVVLIP